MKNSGLPSLFRVCSKLESQQVIFCVVVFVSNAAVWCQDAARGPGCGRLAEYLAYRRSVNVLVRGAGHMPCELSGELNAAISLGGLTVYASILCLPFPSGIFEGLL